MRFDLIAASGLSMIFGVALGGFVGRAVYESDNPSVDPSPPPAMVCPECRPCPVCPPAPDCGDRGLIPRQDNPSLDPEVADDPEAAADPDAPPRHRPEVDFGDGAQPNRGPGLPARAMELARTAIQTKIASCLNPPPPGQLGLLLLGTQVKAADGRGQVREVKVLSRQGEVSQTEACVLQKAQAASFPWDGPAGELPLRITVSVGDY